MKIFSSPLMFLLGVSAVGILVFGCAPTVRENALLEQAQSTFAAAQSNPDVQKNAPLELQKAKVELDQAEKLLERGAEAQEVEHFAYLAKQNTAIAKEIANVKLAEQALDAASEERNKILLEARTQEAKKARLLAETLSAEAQKAKTERLAAEERARKLEAKITELHAVKSERGLVITLGDVLFDTNKTELRSGAQYTIEKLAAFLTEYPKRKVLIEGFTDSTGTVEYNQQLSERRAAAVRDALAAKGTDPSRLMIRGYGVEFPVASNKTAEGRQLNRRVEVIISDEDGQILERKK